jgi:hypothetical protein
MRRGWQKPFDNRPLRVIQITYMGVCKINLSDE